LSRRLESFTSLVRSEYRSPLRISFIEHRTQHLHYKPTPRRKGIEDDAKTASAHILACTRADVSDPTHTDKEEEEEKEICMMINYEYISSTVTF
jgi:hypothetical protein